MQSNRALWPKRNMLVKHCCYWWFEVNIKPVPRCQLQHCRSWFDRLQHLTTCSRLEDFARAWTSLALWSVKRSVGIHPTKTNAQHKLKQHSCAAFQTKFKAAPCTAFPQLLNLVNFAQLRDCEKFIVTSLPLAQLRNGQQLRANCSKSINTSKATWLHMFKLRAGWFQRAGWFLCCPRWTAFFLWTVLKDQRGREETPLRPPPHSIVELTIVILTQMLYCR